MTIGKKMMLSVGAMLLTLLVLAASSLYSIAGLDSELDAAANRDAKKLDIAGAMATNASDMLSFERGMLVRFAMKDLPKAEAYHNSFNERGKAKLQLGLAKGKRKADKRQAEKERDWQRDRARLMRDKG